MTSKFKKIETKLVHAGEPDPRIHGAVALPIFQSAMYETHGGEGYHNVRYIRLNNTPNHIALNKKLAAIENAEDAMVTASGMAAITTGLLTLLSSGDHAIFQNTLYGGTHGFVVNDLPKLGIEYDMVDPNRPGEWEAKLRPTTKIFYIETISNPLMGVPDIERAVEFARAHELTSMIDNTFASPVNFRPAEHGIDLSYHSCTKYLNGHSDVVAGAVIGRADLVAAIKHKLDHLGGTLDPHACFLLHRGLKTLALRVRHQNASALRIAQALEQHRSVTRVNYPGLDSHPNHTAAAELFDGYGGMLSFEIDGGLKEIDRLMRSVRLPVIAPSLGGPETLLTRPAVTSHAGLSKAELAGAGISESLIRMSVGIEDPDEIIEDLSQALSG